jgi:hypothetical protein
VVDRYDLDVSDDNFATFVFQVQLTGTSYTHTADFSFLTRYYWRVRAVDDFGNAGDWSIDSFATVIEAPAAFNLVSPENLAGNVPTSGALTWQASLRASAYDIYLDVADPPVALLAGNVTATTQPYSGLELGTMYYWCVVARNAGGSAQSRTWAFTTAAHTTWPQGWYARDTMPSPQVKDGGALCYNGDVQRVYAIKGNKRDEFYRYSPGETTWTRLADVGGTKPVGKGAAMTTGGGSVFVMKGNATRDFYKFSLADSAWTKAKDIPLALDQTATGGKAVKAGGSLAYVHVRDSDFVYVLKGYGTDFYRYDVARDTHFSLVAAPYTSKPKYDKGSWIVYDGTQYIYVMQSKYNALRRYDVTTEAWDATVLDGMPFNSTVTGKTNKKVGDGSCAAWNPDGGYLFAMKGNGTQEAWKYLPGTNDSWTELESIPQAYSGGKKKKVKSGGGAAYYPEFGTFFVQKGNKTNQFWMCAPGAAGMCNAAPRRDGVSSESAIRSLRSAVSITPNPLTGWAATVRMDLPFAGPALVRVFDASGRCVASREFSARSGASCVGLDLRGLPAGAYLVRVSSPSFTACRKLVVRG